MSLPEETRTCEGCGEDLTHTVNGTQYSKATSVEIRGVYDGGLFYAHTVESGGCGYAWHRWVEAKYRGNNDWASYARVMADKAQPYIDQWNEKYYHPEAWRTRVF